MAAVIREECATQDNTWVLSKGGKILIYLKSHIVIQRKTSFATLFYKIC